MWHHLRGAVRATAAASVARPFARWTPQVTFSGVRAASAAAPPQKDTSEGQAVALVKKYGMWPFAGVASAIALSKELLILNEELVVLFTFSATVYALYTQVGDMVAKSLDDRADKIKSELSMVMDQTLTSLDDEIAASSELLSVADDVDNLYKYQHGLMDRYMIALPNKLKRTINEQITNRLSMLSERERSVISNMQSLMADSSSAYVSKMFEGKSEKDSSALLLEAIQSLSAGETSAKTSDPVADTFAKYFVNVSKKVDESKGTVVKLTDAQKAEWAESLADLQRRDPALKGIEVPVPDSVKL